MRTRIVRIGNSQGVRISQRLLEQSGLKEDVEIEAEGNTLVIRPAIVPRAGWTEAFQAMSREGDDALLDDEVFPTRWEEDEWRW